MASRSASPSRTWVPASSLAVDRSDDPDGDPDSSLSQDHAGASSTDADSDQYDPDDLDDFVDQYDDDVDEYGE